LKRRSTFPTVIPAQAGIQEGEMKQPCVYILASQRNGTLYTGVTSDLIKRVWEHKNDQAEGFTQKYAVHLLVYFEQHDDMNAAITREKQIKKWSRAWKLGMIEEKNPNWNDLYETLL
jgi:putative endonuclease